MTARASSWSPEVRLPGRGSDSAPGLDSAILAGMSYGQKGAHSLARACRMTGPAGLTLPGKAGALSGGGSLCGRQAPGVAGPRKLEEALGWRSQRPWPPVQGQAGKGSTLGATLGVQVDGEGGRVGRAVNGPGEETVVGFWAGGKTAQKAPSPEGMLRPRNTWMWGPCPRPAPPPPQEMGCLGGRASSRRHSRCRHSFSLGRHSAALQQTE